MPEWIEPVEGFRMILRAKRPDNPGLADEITSATWFYYPKMQAEKHSRADFEAAKNALDLLLKSFRDGRIHGRGILQAGHAPIDIDPTDARTGILSVWHRELDCFLFVPGRKFVNVFLKEADVRSLCGARRGRPQEYDWKAIRAKAFALMDYHGDFSADDPEWNAQARLEDQLADFCQREYERAPDSSLREKLPGWLEEWRKQKSQGISALSENQ